MLRTIDKALAAPADERPAGPRPGSPALATDAIVGRSAAMQEVYKAVGRVAQTDATVLIRGESGTGKELVGRAIYQHSLRAQMPLIVM